MTDHPSFQDIFAFAVSEAVPFFLGLTLLRLCWLCHMLFLSLERHYLCHVLTFSQWFTEYIWRLLLILLVWILLYTHLYNFLSIGKTFEVCNFTDKPVFLSLARSSLSLLIKLYFLSKLILMLLVVKAGRHWVCTSYCSQGQAGSRGRASRDSSRSRGHSTCAQRGRGPSICLDAGALSASVAAGWKWRGVGRCKSVVYSSVLQVKHRQH